MFILPHPVNMMGDSFSHFTALKRDGRKIVTLRCSLRLFTSCFQRNVAVATTSVCGGVLLLRLISLTGPSRTGIIFLVPVVPFADKHLLTPPARRHSLERSLRVF